MNFRWHLIVGKFSDFTYTRFDMFNLEEREIKRKNDNKDISLNIGCIYSITLFGLDIFIRYILLCIAKRPDCNIRTKEFCEPLLLT